LGDAPERRSVWVFALVGFVVGALLFGGVGYLIGRPSEQDQMANDIRASDAARDKKQIKALTDLARTTKDDLAPVVTGLKGDAAAADITKWQQTVAAAAKSFDDPPSGSTGTNVARGSLTAAVDQLAVAVDTYQQGPASRQLATRQLDLAVMTWSVGATQLDQINVDAGYGHQHVYLGDNPEAFTADGAEEGTG
jgi:hypothetical protein